MNPNKEEQPSRLRDIFILLTKSVSEYYRDDKKRAPSIVTTWLGASTEFEMELVRWPPTVDEGEEVTPAPIITVRARRIEDAIRQLADEWLKKASPERALVQLAKIREEENGGQIRDELEG